MRVLAISNRSMVETVPGTALCPVKQKGRRKPAALSVFGRSGDLFGRNLPRRVERAGIVDLRHLMIGKTENLPQHLVGMFAEQR
jgi:hypothetical protein